MNFHPLGAPSCMPPYSTGILPGLDIDLGFPPDNGDEIGRLLVLYDPGNDHVDAAPVDLVVSLPDDSEDGIRLGPYVLTRRDALTLAKLLLEAEHCRYDDELEAAECRPDPNPPLSVAACLERPADV